MVCHLSRKYWLATALLFSWQFLLGSWIPSESFAISFHPCRLTRWGRGKFCNELNCQIRFIGVVFLSYNKVEESKIIAGHFLLITLYFAIRKQMKKRQHLQLKCNRRVLNIAVDHFSGDWPPAPTVWKIACVITRSSVNTDTHHSGWAASARRGTRKRRWGTIS